MRQSHSISDNFILCTVLIIIGYNCEEQVSTGFDNRPLNITSIAGETTTLPCTVENIQTYTVAWLNPKKILISQGDRRLMDDIRMTIERPLVPDWNLHIRSVRFNDHGMYTCTLNTKPVMIKRIYLTVLVPPDINENWSSQNQIVHEGSTIQLTCNATGVPQPEISWFRKLRYSRVESKDVIGTPGEILVIHNITRYCDGIYECIASNGVGNDVSKEINVEVHFKPEVRLLNRKISQRIGKETILSCIISASPQAYGVWLKDGKAIAPRTGLRTEIYDDSPHTVTLNLRIINIKESDFGHYTCEASNQLGGDKEGMILYEEVPRTTTSTPQVTETLHTLPQDPHPQFSGGHHVYPKENNIPKEPTYRYTGPNSAGKASSTVTWQFIAVFSLCNLALLNLYL